MPTFSTDNAIKNHWYSSMRKNMRRLAKKLEGDAPSSSGMSGASPDFSAAQRE